MEVTQCSWCDTCKINLFKNLSTPDLERISVRKDQRFLRRGETLFEEGESPKGIYCIRSGICKLTKLCTNGNSQIVRIIKNGTLLGQRSLIGQEKVNLTATAVSDLEYCFIPREIINIIISERPRFMTEIAKELSEELRRTDNFVAEMIQKSVKERLASALFFFQSLFGEDEEGFIDILLSREEIANFVGAATESLIRVLTQMSKSGLVEVSAKRIKILDAKLLKQISEGSFYQS